MRMVKMTSKLIMALMLALMVGAVQAQEQEPIAWSALEKGEQALLAPYAERWDTLDPEQQQRLQRGAARWQQLDSHERTAARQRFERWQQLSPEQKAQIRERYQQFRQLPPEQQQRIRERMEGFRNLPPAEREALREKWQRLTSEERAAVATRLKRQGAAPEAEETPPGMGSAPLQEPFREHRMEGGGPMARQPRR